MPEGAKGYSGKQAPVACRRTISKIEVDLTRTHATEALGATCPCFDRLFLAIARRRLGHQGIHELARRSRYLLEGVMKGGVVGLRRALLTADLANKLQSGSPNLLVGRGRLEVE